MVLFQSVWDPLNEQFDIIISGFQSIPDSFYWCFVTITTVGYGDFVPVTSFGRVVACITMIAGIIIISLPISIIGSNFTAQWERHLSVRKQLHTSKEIKCDVKNAVGRFAFLNNSEPVEFGDILDAIETRLARLNVLNSEMEKTSGNVSRQLLFVALVLTAMTHHVGR